MFTIRMMTAAVLWLAAACKPPASEPAGEASAQAPGESLLALNEGAVEPGVMPLVTGDGYPPFTDMSMPNRGYATELVQEIFQKHGLRFALDVLSWPRAERALERGRYVGSFPFVKTPEREKSLLYSDPVYRVRSLFYTRDDAGIAVNELSDLRGKRLCKPAGYALEDSVEPLVHSGALKLETPGDLESCLKMLKAGRVDLITENDVVFWTAVEKLYGNVEGFVALDYIIQESILYFVASRKHPEAERVLAAFNETLRAFKRAGSHKYLDTTQ